MKTGKTLETSNTVHYSNGLIKEEDNKQKIESNVRRYADLYQKDENYYAMDYGDRFNPKVNEKTRKNRIFTRFNRTKYLFGLWIMSSIHTPIGSI